MPTAKLIDEAYAESRRAEIDPEKAGSYEPGDLGAAESSSGEDENTEGNTTHVSVIDAERLDQQPDKEMSLENGRVTLQARAELIARGHTLEREGEYAELPRVQAAGTNPRTGERLAATDPRSGEQSVAARAPLGTSRDCQRRVDLPSRYASPSLPARPSFCRNSRLSDAVYL